MATRDEQRPPAWGVLLAGGDGTRLQCLTAKIQGDSRPKQFCRLLSGESLLSETRRRIGPIIGADRTIAVVNRSHEAFYTPELSDLQGTAVVAQPQNRGTGIAIAATLLSVPELNADDIVAFFPCDHYYYNPAAFLNALDVGVEAARGNADAIVLIGAEATYPETDYGWIEPGVELANRAVFAVSRVCQVWEEAQHDPACRMIV